MLKLKVKMVMMSHLSDVQDFATGNLAKDKINFVKFLLLKYPNTDTEIDADSEYKLYTEQHKNS